MELYRRQIEELECHLSAISSETAMSPQSMFTCAAGSQSSVTFISLSLSLSHTHTHTSSPDIIEILQLQYKPFLLLAAQLQVVHEQVQVKLVIHELFNYLGF